MTFTPKRLALVGIIAATLTLAGCTGGGPTPSSSSPSDTPSPTSTALNNPVNAPKTQNDAIQQAQGVLATWYKTLSSVLVAGGTDTAPLKHLAIQPALQVGLDGADRIANGPLLNADGQSVPGSAKATGEITFAPSTAYGQTWQGVDNGLVTIDGCQDSSNYHITTHDGKPAMRPPHDRIKLEYQVSYDAKTKLWMVSKQVDLQATC